MRAAVFHGANQPLSIECVPDPAPGPGQVIVRVRRCGICGTDLHLARCGNGLLRSGATLGHEISGEIVESGHGVRRERIGERVAVLPFVGCGGCTSCRAGRPNECDQSLSLGSSSARGGYSEYVMAAAACCIALPGRVDFAEGALVEPLAVAIRGIAKAAIGPRSRVLIIGAGAIGLCAVAWARKSGAQNITVLARTRQREAMARAVGASAFVHTNGSANPSVDVIDRLGDRPDVVLECAGAPGMIDLAVQCVARRGTIVMLGFCLEPEKINIVRATLQEPTIEFSMVYSIEEFQHATSQMEQLGALLSPTIEKTVALDDAPDAFAELGRGSGPVKVQIAPDSVSIS